MKSPLTAGDLALRPTGPITVLRGTMGLNGKNYIFIFINLRSNSMISLNYEGGYF
jgi:hypothetical protein